MSAEEEEVNAVAVDEEDDEGTEEGTSDDDDSKDDDSKDDDSKDDDDDSKDDDDDSKDDDDDENTKNGEDDEEDDDDDDDSKESEPTAVPVVIPKPVVPAPNLNRHPPKMRIKLSIKLPTKANAAAAAKKEGSDTVDGDAVAVVIPDANNKSSSTQKKSKPTASSTSSATKKAAVPAKRRSAHPSRPIRLPPISSPGLFMAQPSQGNSKTASNNTTATTSLTASLLPDALPTTSGLVTPHAVFLASMAAAGYTRENRTKTPHRGSSVTRTVGDLFDSNVKLTLHFPDLLDPAHLRRRNKEPSADGREEKETEERSAASLLLASLPKAPGRPAAPLGAKRKRPRSFDDMVPVSLTMPYPESFLQKRVKYVDEVLARERAIVAHQEATVYDEDEAPPIVPLSISSNASAASSSSPSKKEPIVIPPIPEPPEPPTLQDLEDASNSSSTTFVLAPSLYTSDRHPIYIPRKKDFLSHLDPDCFHISEGRYFGLVSNFCADPNYVGPNAPGISGMHASGGAGLATSSAGSGTGGLALTVSASYHQQQGLLAGGSHNTSSAKAEKKKVFVLSDGLSSSGASPVPTASLVVGTDESPSSATSKQHCLGPKPTATALDLRKLLDEATEHVKEAVTTCIIRAAVHASRSGRHGQSFVAPPQGETYPDVSKAFSAHAGIKPCPRCKSNKQGAYHCRLRRRHKDPDYDGGNSLAAMEPLFTAPMESLLENNGEEGN